MIHSARLSIRALMAVIVVSAIGLAAIRNASDLWAGLLLMIVLGFVGAAILGAIFSRGARRAWWTGFALFSGGYLVLALVPWLSAQLGTTQLLNYVHARAVTSTIASFELSRLDKNTVLYRIVSPDGGVHESKVADSVYKSTGGSELLDSIAPVNRWRSALPGAANHDQFQRVGHSLFALLAALVGGTVAVWFYEKQVRAEAATTMSLNTEM
jgi:uncharacterized membrane protein YeaQ/YmgE (transglycosylase-associated protein family)